MFNVVTLNTEKTFRTRTIELPNIGEVIIGTTHLSDALFGNNSDNDSFVSSEAEEIDNTIFFYVEKDQLELPDNELIAIVLDGVK
jgi:hypothetical protein